MSHSTAVSRLHTLLSALYGSNRDSSIFDAWARLTIARGNVFHRIHRGHALLEEAQRECLALPPAHQRILDRTLWPSIEAFMSPKRLDVSVGSIIPSNMQELLIALSTADAHLATAAKESISQEVLASLKQRIIDLRTEISADTAMPPDLRRTLLSVLTEADVAIENYDLGGARVLQSALTSMAADVSHIMSVYEAVHVPSIVERTVRIVLDLASAVDNSTKTAAMTQLMDLVTTPAALVAKARKALASRTARAAIKATSSETQP